MPVLGLTDANLGLGGLLMFSIGDKVKCIRDNDSDLIGGQQYEVDSSFPSTSGYRIHVKGGSRYYNGSRFIPWVDPIDGAMEEFDAVSSL